MAPFHLRRPMPARAGVYYVPWFTSRRFDEGSDPLHGPSRGAPTETGQLGVRAPCNSLQ
jgi:hypothetical protein